MDKEMDSVLAMLERINDQLRADIARIAAELEEERHGLYERRAEAPAKGGREEENAGGRQG